MYYNTQVYLALKEQRKHKLFMYSMLLALLLVLVNLVTDYLLTNHISTTAIAAIAPLLTFLLMGYFMPFKQRVYRSFYFVFVVIIIDAILNARPEHATSTYWAYLIIISIFTYERSLKNAVIINSLAFLSLATLLFLNYVAVLELPYSLFNYFSFLMIYIVLSIFVFIMVKNFTGIEMILHQQSQALQNNINELSQVQKNLIEAEKMAALGSLVAGISHEVNTPLGIALTAVTHNQDRLIDIEEQLHNKKLKQSALQQSIDAQQKGHQIILKNLDRANTLISHFKQVAVDQASESLRKIYIGEYIQEIIDSMSTLFKQKDIKFHLDAPEKLKLNTYPGPIYQVISNLFNNSALHGFEQQKTGNIYISVAVSEREAKLTYVDDGIGMDKEILTKIYEPFVTSKRNQGGSGLGMNIVYNLVTQVLEGTIDCQSTKGEGIKITIIFPVERCT